MLTAPLVQVSIPLQFEAKTIDGFDKTTVSSTGGDISSVAAQMKRYELLKKIQTQLNHIKQTK